MNVESILNSHAKKFINPKHTVKSARGLVFDGNGSCYATDAVQVLKVSGLVPVGFPWVQGLNGKPIDADEPTTMKTLETLENTFDRDIGPGASVSVKDLLNASSILNGVQKEDLKGRKKAVRDLMKVRLVAENGKLFIRYESPMACEFVYGSVEIGASDESFIVLLDSIRLVDCLNVFGEEFDTVNVSVCDTLVRFEAGDVAVALLPLT